MGITGRSSSKTNPEPDRSQPQRTSRLTGLLSQLDGDSLTVVEKAASSASQADDRLRQIKQHIQRRLLLELNPVKSKKEKDKEKDKDRQEQSEEKRQMSRTSKETTEQLHKRIQSLYHSILSEEGFSLNRAERQLVFEQIVADVLGFGPLEKLLNDRATTDIMVVGHEKVFVERKGRLQETTIRFDDETHLRHIIDRILSPLNRRIDETSPMVDARLPDGSRVNAVIPPVALDGCYLTIRKFAPDPLKVQDLIGFGTCNEDMFEFLHAAVKVGLNIMVSGGSSSGKTTLLNVLSSFIPSEERVVTIENAAELQLQQDHVIRLETRPPNIEGEGEMTLRDLVINSLRMRPDRIIVGEVRDAEALDLLQAMNSGRDGSMGTIHANTPSDALSRLETMCTMAGMDLPLRAIREQVSSAIDIVVQMIRLRDGSRKVTAIAEVEGMEGDSILLSTIFEWHQTGASGDGQILGYVRPTGLTPRCVRKFSEAGYHISPAIFGLTSFESQRLEMSKVWIDEDEEETPEETAQPAGSPPSA